MSDQRALLCAFAHQSDIFVACDATVTKPMFQGSVEGHKGHLGRVFRVGVVCRLDDVRRSNVQLQHALARPHRALHRRKGGVFGGCGVLIGRSSPVSGSSRFAPLWAEQSKDSFSPDFAIGPGNLLRISVPDMEQLKDREARVSASGTIELPILGVVEVGGLPKVR